MVVRKSYKILLIAFLLGVTIFSVFKYLVSLKERYDLLDTLEKIKAQVAVLENEKQNLWQTIEKQKQLEKQLNEQNAGLKESLKVSEEKLSNLNTDFIQAKNIIEQLNSEITILKTQNTTLKQEKDDLNVQLQRISQDNENLKARFGSLAELKKAIKDLKRQMHSVSREIKEKVNNEKAVKGNRGFLIKDGKSTYPTNVRIQVIPVPKNE